MNRFLIILIILISLFLVSCSDSPTNEYIGKRFEVIVTEKYDEEGIYTVKTYNYKITNIWIMVAEDYEYEIGNIIAVVIVMEDIAVPYIEYVDNTIDGYVFKKTEWGIGWVKE